MEGAKIRTTRDSFHRTAASAAPGARIPVAIELAVADPFQAYRRARRGSGSGDCYLETGGGQQGRGYFGVDPIERIHIQPDAVTADTTGSSPSLAALDARIGAEELVRGDCDVPYPCGAIGWLSYDLVREFERVPSTTVDDRQLPQIQLAMFDRLASWPAPCTDDADVTLTITACPRLEGSVDEAYDRGIDRATSLATLIRKGSGAVSPLAAGVDQSGEFTSQCGQAAFEDRVRRVKEYIRDGETFQANISQRLVAPAVVHPVEAFAALREVNPAPYSGLLEFPRVDLISASPELLLRHDGPRIETEPIAGTRPRGSTPSADARLEAELRGDEKERAEHAMLVDLERNDLGKVSEYGSVTVSEYRRVDRYAAVMHLVSVVEGRKRVDASLEDVIMAVFPGGTITGAPKPRTMEIIDEVERVRRGPYTGSIGLFGFDGRATLNIVIRTLVRVADEFHLRVGAGIVHDSIPEREYQETMDKARALIEAVNTALGSQVELNLEGGGQ